MLVSAAVCPHPPALVPAVSQRAAGLLGDLREHCFVAVRRLRAAEPDLLICVGAGEETRHWGPRGGGSLRPFGVDAGFGGPEPGLPLSLSIAAYLLGGAGAVDCQAFQEVSGSASPEVCREGGSEIAALAERVALLVMGDGSARRTRESPGPFDEQARVFDEEAVRALSAPDAGALLAIDPATADDLWVAGRPAWQVLAGALLASPGNWAGRVVYDAAPLGVGYAVIQLDRD